MNYFVMRKIQKINIENKYSDIYKEMLDMLQKGKKLMIHIMMKMESYIKIMWTKMICIMIQTIGYRKGLNFGIDYDVFMMEEYQRCNIML